MFLSTKEAGGGESTSEETGRIERVSRAAQGATKAARKLRLEKVVGGRRVFASPEIWTREERSVRTSSSFEGCQSVTCACSIARGYRLCHLYYHIHILIQASSVALPHPSPESFQAPSCSPPSPLRTHGSTMLAGGRSRHHLPSAPQETRSP